MIKDLYEVAYDLLAPTRSILDVHKRDPQGTCQSCHTAWPCFDFDTAVSALDLVTRVHLHNRRQQDALCDALFEPGAEPA